MNPVLLTIQTQLQEKNYATISRNDLAVLLEDFQLVQEENTFVSGLIRILAGAQSHWVQEEDTRGKIFIRNFTDLAEAKKFVSDRLVTYDKMWDGCGCKIDYYI
jgi:hypothetical protein